MAVLPTPGVADQQRIVLLPAAEDIWIVRCTSGLAADQRIDAAVARLAVEVDAISVERFLLLLVLVSSPPVRASRASRSPLRRRARGGFPAAGALGDAVADVVDRVVAGHVLLLQEIGGMALALGEHGDEHVGAGHLLAAGGLDVDDGALDHALETGGGLGIVAAVGARGWSAPRRYSRRGCGAACRDRRCRHA